MDSGKIKVLVSGAPGIAAVLSNSGKFVDVVAIASTSELRSAIQDGLLSGASPDDLLFIFSDATVDDTPTTPLSLLVSRLSSSGWKVLIAAVSPHGRAIVDENPSCGLLSPPFTANNIIGGLVGISGIHIEPVAEPWGFADVDPDQTGQAAMPEASHVPSSWAAATSPQPNQGPGTTAGQTSVESPSASWVSEDADSTSPWGTAPVPAGTTAPAVEPAPIQEAPAQPAAEPEPVAPNPPSAPSGHSWHTADDPAPPDTSHSVPTAPVGDSTQSFGSAWESDDMSAYWQRPEPTPAPLAGMPIVSDVSMRKGKVIPITVAKGGAGKSTVTLNLAVFAALQLRAAGKKVCVVDANFQQADIGDLIGSYSPNIATLAKTTADISPERINRHVVFRQDLNTAFLLGPALTEEANPRWITPQLYTAAVDALRQVYDYIFVDTPVAEFHHSLFSGFILPSSDFLIIPVNPDYRAIQNADRWLRAVTESELQGGEGVDPDRVGYLLNRASEAVDCSEDQVRVEMGNWNYLGSIPSTDVWQRAANNREIVATLNYADLNLAFANILYEATGEEVFGDIVLSSQESESRKKGFLSKVLRR